jgi:tetratricopeptide (TPR) repeat protein
VVGFEEEGDEILETSATEGWYFFIGENQGCCGWIVRDDGTDDPPVFVGDGFIIPEWRKVSEHLSTFLFDWIASFRYRAYTETDSVKVLVARDRLPNDEELIRLRATWQAGPRRAHPEALTHYRFFRKNAFLKIGIWAEDDELAPQSRWQLSAANAEALAESAKLLWPLASLASTLRPEFFGDTLAQRVLASLGQVRKPPQSAWDYYELGEEKRMSGEPAAIAEALDLFARAIQLDPTMLCAHQRRVYCYQELQDHQALISEYTAMLALRDDPYSRMRRAEHLSKLERHEEAAQDLCDVIRIDAEYSNFLEKTQPLRDAGRLDLVRLVMECWRNHSPGGWKSTIDKYFDNERISQQ